MQEAMLPRFKPVEKVVSVDNRGGKFNIGQSNPFHPNSLGGSILPVEIRSLCRGWLV